MNIKVGEPKKYVLIPEGPQVGALVLAEDNTHPEYGQSIKFTYAISHQDPILNGQEIFGFANLERRPDGFYISEKTKAYRWLKALGATPVRGQEFSVEQVTAAFKGKLVTLIIKHKPGIDKETKQPVMFAGISEVFAPAPTPFAQPVATSGFVAPSPMAAPLAAPASASPPFVNNLPPQPGSGFKLF